MIFDQSEPSHSHRTVVNSQNDQTTMTDEKQLMEKLTIDQNTMTVLATVNKAIQATKIFLHISTQVESGDVEDDLETTSNYSRASRRSIRANRYLLDPS